jgi:hypothetical protein
MDGVNINSQTFFNTYGDCYISGAYAAASLAQSQPPSRAVGGANSFDAMIGFVYGGELHGIVSMKVLNPLRRNQIIST